MIAFCFLWLEPVSSDLTSLLLKVHACGWYYWWLQTRSCCHRFTIFMQLLWQKDILKYFAFYLQSNSLVECLDVRQKDVFYSWADVLGINKSTSTCFSMSGKDLGQHSHYSHRSSRLQSLCSSHHLSPAAFQIVGKLSIKIVCVFWLCMTSEQFSHQIVTNLFITFLSWYLSTLQKTTGTVAAELTELCMWHCYCRPYVFCSQQINYL